MLISASAARSSPSSRRAWIEISPLAIASARMAVALLAEGVDRNPQAVFLPAAHPVSPSSRRAWIEIFVGVVQQAAKGQVALLAEGVDRNPYHCETLLGEKSRPPRGGRG